MDELYIMLAWSDLVIIRMFFAFLGQTSVINIVILLVYFPEINIRSSNSKFV
jgi:hypothetical protein